MNLDPYNTKANKVGDTYVKNVREKEMLITKLASEHGIAPALVAPIEIVNKTRAGNNIYKIVLEAYPYTLGGFNRTISSNAWAIYEEEITTQVKNLHALGYIHGDLHRDNIVVNPKTGDVRLIDFGISRSIDSKVYSSYDRKIGPVVKTANDLCLRELYVIEQWSRGYTKTYMQNNRPGAS